MTRTRREMSEQTKRLKDLIKPLASREERAAIDAATDHLRGELSDRYRFFPADVRVEKPRRSGAAVERAVALLLVDYEGRRTVEVLVNGKGQVSRVTDLTGFQPGFLSEEVKEARALAERDERVARARKVRGAFVSAFGPEPSREAGARLVGLRYAVVDAKGRGRLLGEAVVDLSAQRLARFDVLGEEEGV